MEPRHREEEENLAHCLVSGGGGWTQGFLQSAPDRGAPPPVNSEPAQNTPDVTLHVHTSSVLQWFLLTCPTPHMYMPAFVDVPPVQREAGVCSIVLASISSDNIATLRLNSKSR